MRTRREKIWGLISVWRDQRETMIFFTHPWCLLGHRVPQTWDHPILPSSLYGRWPRQSYSCFIVGETEALRG